MKKIVFASNNAGKVREVNAILASQSFEVVSQSEFNVVEAEETGLTFVENAILKARNAAEQTGLPALADDSGLEVDALNGAPGIYSARFAGPDATDEKNLQKLLHDLDTLEKEKGEVTRSARFQCVMVLMRHASDPTPLICQGTWEGTIGREPAGDNGFGYDPVFYVEQQQCTAAELSAEIKNRLSHRGQALAKLLDNIGQYLI